MEGFPVKSTLGKFGSSFRDGPKDQTRKFEIISSNFRVRADARPGMTVNEIWIGSPTTANQWAEPSHDESQAGLLDCCS